VCGASGTGATVPAEEGAHDASRGWGEVVLDAGVRGGSLRDRKRDAKPDNREKAAPRTCVRGAAQHSAVLADGRREKTIAAEVAS
jgi:hypothetical protein